MEIWKKKEEVLVKLFEINIVKPIVIQFHFFIAVFAGNGRRLLLVSKVFKAVLLAGIHLEEKRIMLGIQQGIWNDTIFKFDNSADIIRF